MWFSKKFIFLVFLISFGTASASLAEISVISHPSRKGEWNEKHVRDLYLGLLKMKKIVLLEQASGQKPRDEFYEKFLKKNESQLKQQWSILVFSGERAPLILSDNKSIFEYVKGNPNAIGYVSSDYFRGQTVQASETHPVEIFSVK